MEGTVDLFDEFVEIVNIYPQKSALIDNGKEISYQELYDLSIVLSEMLGYVQGVVGVLATHSSSSIVALLGLLKANCIYCPLDPNYSTEKLTQFAAKVGCSVVIQTAPDQTPPDGFAVIDLSDLTTLRKDGPSQFRPLIRAKDKVKIMSDAAYILFTSGSTGDPKPVLTPTKAISKVISELRKLFAITPEDRVLQFASLNWDTCFEEIWPTLTSGATLIIDDEAYKGSMIRFLKLIEKNQVSILNLPTAFWHELVYHLFDDYDDLPKSLSVCIIGGEALRVSRLSQWKALNTSDIRLVNTYGSTETTLITHAIDLHGPRCSTLPSDWFDPDNAPIGNKLTHIQEIISEEGELLIGGCAIADGYFGMENLTEARFVQIGKESNKSRFYCTGDRVERHSSGMLFHLGRLDNQLKIRGIRVEPGAVEAEILKIDGVSLVAVVGDSVADHVRLIAYVVPKRTENAATLPEKIISTLRLSVPNYLIPSSVNVVANLERRASGKIDRMSTHKNFQSI